MAHYDHLDQSIELMNSMEQYSNGLTSKTIEIVWGENPSTDGKTIYLPSIPKHANEKLVRMHQSTVLHEVGHIECSDFKLLKRRANSIKPMLHSIWNAIEDVWMEGEMMKRWNGAEFILRDGLNTAMRVGAVKDGSTPEDIVPMYAYFKAYIRNAPHWTELEGPLSQFQQKAEHKFGSLVESIASLINDVMPHLASSRDCLALAEAIFNLLPPEEQNKRPSAGESKDNSKALQGAKEESQEEFEAKAEQSDDAEDSDKSEDESETTDESDDEGESEENDKGEEESNSESSDGAGETGELKRVTRANLPYFKKPLPNGARLAQVLRPILLDAERKQTSNMTSGRLNARHLARVAMDDPRIFRKKRYETEVVASVGTLIDLSASMSTDDRLETALNVSAELSAALGHLSVPSGVFGFGDRKKSTLVVAKPMDTARPDGRIFGLRDAMGGSTPLGEALAVIPDHFREVTRKKVLFIITDGDPNSAELAERNTKKLIEQGIEPIVINVGDGMSFRPPCLFISVAKPADLSVVLRKALTQALVA